MSDEVKDIDILDILNNSISNDEDEIIDVVSNEEVGTQDTKGTSDSTIDVNSSDVKDDSTRIDINSLIGAGLVGQKSNKGSGDVTTDLLNWLNNSDTMPSDPLTSYLSNSHIKAEFSLYYLLLNNMSRMKTIDEFLRDAESILYNTRDIHNLDPDELKERYVNANKVMENLLTHSTRIVANIKKNKNDDEMDKLKMLLGAIPSNKLKEIIGNLK